MRTKEQVKKAIEELEDLIKARRKAKDKKAENQLTKKLYLQRQVLAYLYTEPNIGFLNAEKLRLQILIKSKKATFMDWLVNNQTFSNERKNRREFNKEMGLTQHRRQLRFINQILN